MSAPKRIQRKRTKGWRMPEGAVYVGRPTKWGNPWKVRPQKGMWFITRPGWTTLSAVRAERTARWEATNEYRNALSRYPWGGHLIGISPDLVRAELAGRDLVCWCPLDQPCHADVLLEIANAPASTTKEARTA